MLLYNQRYLAKYCCGLTFNSEVVFDPDYTIPTYGLKSKALLLALLYGAR